MLCLHWLTGHQLRTSASAIIAQQTSGLTLCLFDAADAKVHLRLERVHFTLHG